MIAFALFALAILGFFLLRRTATARRLNPGAVVILAYLFMNLAIYGVGGSHLDSPLAEQGKTPAMITVLAHCGIALYALMRIGDLRQRSFLLGCLAVGLTFDLLVGLIQSSLHIDLKLLFEPPGFVVIVPTQGNVAPTAVDTLVERFGATRVVGTSGHPIEFAVLAAITVPLTVHFARHATHKWIRQFAACAAVVAVIAMPAGVARSGVVALTAALLVYVWTFKLRQIAATVIVGALALMIEFVAYPHNLQALWATIINSGDDASIMSRVEAWARVSQVFHEQPTFGIGLGAGPPALYGYLDNEWMQAILGGGVVGLTAMALLAVGGIFGIAGALRSAKSLRERDLVYAMGAMFMGLLASSYTFDLFGFRQAALIFFLLLGLLWSSFSVSFDKTMD